MSRATENTKSGFKKLITEIRTTLLADLETAVYQRYSLSAKDRTKVDLSFDEQRDYNRLNAYLKDPSRFHNDYQLNLKDLIKERAYTLTNRMVILMQLECRGLRTVTLISGGVENSAFRREQEFFVALTQGDDLGFRFILQQVWDQLSLELPALFEYNEVHQCIPISGPTLLSLIEKLNRKEVQDVWTDDTTLGWLYQYWNDPDRKAVDYKLNNTSGKVEAHELSDKTQLFTERYMVEWLVQNSLGTQWLAICEKNRWPLKAAIIIDELKTRRIDWNKRIDQKEISETGVMPTEGKEEFWKYYVPQEIAIETVDAAPNNLQDIKVLDPAMGSGHFLVYVFDFLHELYLDQARLLGTEYEDEQIVKWILENNLHGIDIDNRAVQIGAAALYIKAQEMVSGFSISKLNLVASDLGLSHLEKDDPAVLTFFSSLEEELGIHKDVSYEIIKSLKGAEYMGSLLQVDKEIDRIIKSFRVYNDAFDIGEVKEKILSAIEEFIHHHDQGEDLGLCSLAQQMAKGLRLIELLGQKYDVVVANPPYLGIAKARKEIAEAVQLHYQEGKADFYSIFILRALELLKDNGKAAMVTLRGWMFLSQFEEIRLKLLRETNILAIGDLHLGAFHDMKDVSATMFVLQKSNLNTVQTKIVRPVPKLQIRRDQYQVSKNERGLLRADEVYSLPQSRFPEIPGSPMIYWWPEEFRQAYLKAPKLGEIGETRQGMATSSNIRFIRKPFELNMNDISIVSSSSKIIPTAEKKWFSYLKGAGKDRWFSTIEDCVNYNLDGFELKLYANVVFTNWTGRIINRQYYFKQGLAFNATGTDEFVCRLRKYKSIFDVKGASIFCSNPEKIQVLLSANMSSYVSQSMNPTISNQNGNINNLPIFDEIGDYYLLYLKRIEALYNNLFASTESNLEYTYKHQSSEEFEVEEARIRNEIDKELMAQFSEETVKAIYQEIGESVFDYPSWDEREHSIPDNFTDTYQTESSLMKICRIYKIHPDSVLKIKDHLGLIHQSQCKDMAFKDLSWVIGVLLGRFDAQTGGLVDMAGERRREAGLSIDSLAPIAHPNGLIYLTALDDMDGLDRDYDFNSGNSCLKSLKDILAYKWGEERTVEKWQEIEDALVLECRTDWLPSQRVKKNLNEWIRTKAFAMHETIYQKRSIYFPLVSEKKSFFIWVNIHKWNDGTLNSCLANYLNPDLGVLESRIRRLREDVQASDDNRLISQLEKEIARLALLLDELQVFISKVSQLASKGPAPELTEREMPYEMNLDDGVMVNSSALWELVLPLWKEPKKWWVSLSKPVGKKDFDWSHLSMRYWPDRVMEKVKKDPSLAVAHSDYGEFKGRDLFKELHSEAAKKWEEQQEKKVEQEFDFG